MNQAGHLGTKEGAEAQRDFVKSYSAVQQDAIHNPPPRQPGPTIMRCSRQLCRGGAGSLSLEAERQALNIGMVTCLSNHNTHS